MLSVTVLNAAARELIESGALAHFVTVDEDGSAQVSIIWVGLDGDELVAAHLDGRQRKLRNMRRDPRVVLSLEAKTTNEIGMRHSCVVHGVARITEGGAPELLQRLAQTYVGPGTVFPPFPDPPAGYVTRIMPTRVSGAGPWAD